MIIYMIEGRGVTRFESARAKASAKVTELATQLGGKRADFDVTELDFDTRKEPLLEALNQLCERKENGGGSS